MGSGSYSYDSFSSTTRSATLDSSGRRKSADQVFRQNRIHELLNPHGLKFRESCDSLDNPESRPIIVGLDVTGSMGFVAEEMIANGVVQFMESIFKHGVVKNPHVLFAAFSDVVSFAECFQVTQFEADVRIIQQLQNVWLQGGGGGNNTESYDLVWHFAANHTKIDSYDKRGEKGILFTIGDECAPQGLTCHEINNIYGYKPEVHKFTPEQLVDAVKEKWSIFHIIAEEGSYARDRARQVYNSWYQLIGNRALCLDKAKYLAQVMASAIRVSEGEDPDDVIASYANDGSECQKSIHRALFSPYQQQQ